MIKKLLGITDGQIVKKSNFYGYLFTAILGGIMMIVGIGMIVYNYSDTHNNIIQQDHKYINYLEKVYDKVNDENLPHIIKAYNANVNLIDELPRQDGLFFFLLGIALIINFILFLELKSKVINSKNE